MDARRSWTTKQDDDDESEETFPTLPNQRKTGPTPTPTVVSNNNQPGIMAMCSELANVQNKIKDSLDQLKANITALERSTKKLQQQEARTIDDAINDDEESFPLPPGYV